MLHLWLIWKKEEEADPNENEHVKEDPIEENDHEEEEEPSEKKNP